jgi:hypothetical protein
VVLSTMAANVVARLKKMTGIHGDPSESRQ